MVEPLTHTRDFARQRREFLQQSLVGLTAMAVAGSLASTAQAADRQLKPWAVVDSLGDCSYLFLAETPTEILCAYYSQHEDGVCKPFLCGFGKREFLGGV